MQLTVLPLLAERMENKFDIFEALENTLEKNETDFALVSVLPEHLQLNKIERSEERRVGKECRL